MKILSLYLIFILMIFLTSCADPSTPEVEKSKTIYCNLTSLLEFEKPDFINDSNLIGYMNYQILNTVINSSSYTNTMKFKYVSSYAKFCNLSTQVNNHGDLLLNNVKQTYTCIIPECYNCDVVPDCSYKE